MWFCHACMGIFCAVNISNTKMSVPNDQSFHDSLLISDQNTVTTRYIPMLLYFRNGEGHCDVTSRCTSPIHDNPDASHSAHECTDVM